MTPTTKRLLREISADDPWIATIDGVLTPGECRELIEHTERVGYGDAPVNTAIGQVRRPELRNNQRVMEDDVARAAWLWERLRPFVPPRRAGWQVVGLNERFRYYRYEEGEYFRWHLDGSFARSHRERSFITVMVYLNDRFRGGTTDFDMLGSVQPEVGMALLFDHRVLHQGAPVRAGVKYVLRTDVMFRAP